jgi:purine-binding chemotaxis protein CheW
VVLATSDVRASEANRDQSFLICRVGTRLCGLPLADVVETMRPLPVRPVSGTPDWLLGASVIRGAVTPVLDALALAGEADGVVTRFVTLALGARQVALAVSEVLGIRALSAAERDAFPPLLRHGASPAAEAIASLDAELLVVLDPARLLGDEVWAAIEAQESPA